jgi:hypothetical protein
MAAPNDRRIRFSTHVVPQLEETLEEGTVKYSLDPTVNKRFGGRGSITITADQGLDGWISIEAQDNTWEADTTTNWEDDSTVWDGSLSIANGSATVLRASDTITFLYIRNTGSNDAKLALEGNEYDILIPAGASISIRVNSINGSNIKVDTVSGTTTIEYIIAK